MLGRRSASALCWVHQKFSRVGKSISAIRVCSGVNNVSFRWVIRIDTSFYESRHPGRWEYEEGYQYDTASVKVYYGRYNLSTVVLPRLTEKEAGDTSSRLLSCTSLRLRKILEINGKDVLLMTPLEQVFS